MQNTEKCKCGSKNIVYVVQKGRGRMPEAYCEKCLPVEALEPGPPDKEIVEQKL